MECVSRWDWRAALAALQPKFTGYSIKICPSLFGVPSTRRRSWTFVWRAAKHGCAHDDKAGVDSLGGETDEAAEPHTSSSSSSVEAEFEQCFRRVKLATAEIYMLAKTEDVNQFTMQQLQVKGLNQRMVPRLQRTRVGLAAGDRQRLHDYEAQLRLRLDELGLRDTPPGTIVDLGQTVAFANISFRGTVGALLRRRCLWDLAKSRRLMLYPEEFAVQGWPVYQREGGGAGGLWGPEYERLFKVCSHQSISMMLGNGMHLVVCASFLLWALAGLTDLDTQEDQEDLELEEDVAMPVRLVAIEVASAASESDVASL